MSVRCKVISPSALHIQLVLLVLIRSHQGRRPSATTRRSHCYRGLCGIHPPKVVAGADDSLHTRKVRDQPRDIIVQYCAR
ncbi:hypothetical protein BD311DRAFT_753310 [Dichomitus squalens]|uniref:Secreted protein n=1 Tax=Dichomitus squalens TaxID=114155 RepID=A0A4Q9MWR1_9APHY|nr:hypothetical protein BD311DRAFT_753310 [Dichomitus squalens]